MSTTNRIARALAAGILGAAKALAWLVVGFVLSVVLMRTGLQWYAGGTFALFPSPARATAAAANVSVMGATPRERAAIQRAVASLRYQLPPRSVTFGVTDDPMCAECGGSYAPALDLVQVYRPVAEAGGAQLRQAVAHEIGHYVDQHHLSEAERARFKELRGIPASITWRADDLSWRDRPIEDFAEVFAILNVPSVVSPIQTSYGRISEPAAFERLLESAGVRLDQPPAKFDLRAAFAEQVAFLTNMVRIPTRHLVTQVVIAAYAAYFGLLATANAWRRTRVYAAPKRSDTKHTLDGRRGSAT